MKEVCFYVNIVASILEALSIIMLFRRATVLKGVEKIGASDIRRGANEQSIVDHINNMSDKINKSINDANKTNLLDYNKSIKWVAIGILGISLQVLSIFLLHFSDTSYISSKSKTNCEKTYCR
jgi:hypothetical protein